MSLNVLDLLRSKAIQSKQDFRLATVTGVTDEYISMEMEGGIKRVFPVQVVEQGFVLHLDNPSLIKAVVTREINASRPMTDADVYKLSCHTFDLMSRRFTDMTNKECYKTLRDLFPRVN